MNAFIDPKLFSLPPSTKLKQVGANQFDIIIQRKSSPDQAPRTSAKDGKGVLAKVDKIRHHVPKAKVSLRKSAPVCSKTKAFLKERGISVLEC